MRYHLHILYRCKSCGVELPSRWATVLCAECMETI